MQAPHDLNLVQMTGLLAGGLALFLFGLQLLTDGLKGALIPWNSCGAYMAATLGVATFSYAPFTVFCWLSPLVTIAFAFLGVRMLRLKEAGD